MKTLITNEMYLMRFVSERMVRLFLDYHQQNFNRKTEGNQTLQKKASIMKGRDRKLECRSSELDIAAEPAASGASEQKNPNWS